MRKIYILLFTLAAACCFAGCTREDAVETTGNGDVIIRLEVDGLETKSAANADENYVESLQVLVFKDVNAAPAKHLTPSITAGAGPFEQTYATVTAFGGFTTDELKTATVFAVANYSASLSGVSSLADAKAKTVNADGFLENTAEGWDVKDAPRFVMTAQGSFTMGTGTDAGKAVANLTLRRLASKVSIGITYASLDPENPITTEDEANKTKTVWTPMTEGNVRVYLSNAVNNGKLEGYADTPVLFTYTDNHPEGEGTLSSAPFYTYPTTWDMNSDDAPYIKIIQPWSYTTVKYEGTSASPTNPVVIDQNVVELYYKVVFPGITSLAPNTWYKPTVTLNVLGGESNRNMVELSTTGFDILPWGTVSSGAGGLSPIVIEPAKYIAVERENTIVNHGGTVSINYVASGPATVTVNTITKQTYLNAEPITRYIYPSDGTVEDALVGGPSFPAGTTDASYWFSNTYNPTTNEGTIVLNHKLSSSFSDPSFAARPYNYSLTLSLDAGGVSDENFTITQVPSVLVECYLSTGWVAVNGKTSDFGSIYRARTSSSDNAITNAISNTASNRYVYQRSDKSTSMGYVNTYVYLNPSENNSSRYRAIIQTAPDNTLYVLDPRKDLSTTSYADIPTDDELYDIINTYKDSGNTIHEGTPLTADSGDIAKILKYRPTINPDRSNATEYPANDAKEHYGREIAPEFMVASSYGKGSGTSYARAVLRCAAYQEDGYPAGRWRLPTEAEIYYCVELSRKGAMPSVFGGLAYWSSSGRLFQTDEKWSKQNYFATGYTRCVYDTWYWGRGEVEALKDGTYTDATGTYQKYKWSGWDYITK